MAYRYDERVQQLTPSDISAVQKLYGSRKMDLRPKLYIGPIGRLGSGLERAPLPDTAGITPGPSEGP